MKRKNKIRVMAIFLSFLIVLPIFTPLFCCRCRHKQETTEVKTTTETTEMVDLSKEEDATETIIETEPQKSEIDILYEQMHREVSEIPYDYTNEKKEWFIAYKEILNNYPKEMYTTIYDIFSEREINLLFRVVQAEVGNYDFISKCNVASVIFNRHYYFQANISSILFANNQFETITNGLYLKVEVDEDTILACEYVFIFGDTTNGAMFFDSTNGNSWAAHNKVFIFRDSAGHDFYR